MSSTHALSHAQLSVLLELLQSRLAALERRHAVQSGGLSQTESARQALLEDEGDPYERSGTQEVEGALSAVEDTKFAALENALQRIHGAGYGVCVDCGRRIPFERLSIEPQALRCTACQTVRERKPLS